MEISLKESDFLESFDLLWSKDLDKYKKNKLNLFVLKINSNEFDYDLLVDMLLDPVIDYSLSLIHIFFAADKSKKEWLGFNRIFESNLRKTGEW